MKLLVVFRENKQPWILPGKNILNFCWNWMITSVCWIIYCWSSNFQRRRNILKWRFPCSCWCLLRLIIYSSVHDTEYEIFIKHDEASWYSTKISLYTFINQPSIKRFPLYKRWAKLRNKRVVMRRYLLRQTEKQASVIFSSWLVFFSG